MYQNRRPTRTLGPSKTDFKKRRDMKIAQTRSMPYPQIIRTLPPASLGLRGAARPEVKAVDIPLQGKLLSTTATFHLLNGIQEGSSFYNRIGRRIEMKSLHLTGWLDQTGNGAGVDDYCRIMVIYDQQPTGAFPTIASILTSYDNTGNPTTTVSDHLNLNNRDRYTMLADIRFTTSRDAGLSTDGTIGATNSCQETNINRFIKLRGLQTMFNTTTNPAAIGDISTGALYLVTYGRVVAATAAYTLMFTSRLRYRDN